MPCVGRGPWAGQDILAFLLLNNFFELYHTSLETKTLIGFALDQVFSIYYFIFHFVITNEVQRCHNIVALSCYFLHYFFKIIISRTNSRIFLLHKQLVYW